VILGILKRSFEPASITTMVLLLVVGLVLLFGRRQRLARWWFTAMCVCYWTLSCPAGAGLLARSLTADYRPLTSAAEAKNAQAVVLLSAGSRTVRAAGGRLLMVTHPTALRALETARVYRLLGDPLVIVSGGVTDPMPGALPESEAMRLAMIALGVPAERIVGESESANTHDEAVVLKRMLVDRGIERFVLVTSPLHMGRSLATFASQGLYPVPSAAPLYQDRDRLPQRFALMPNDASLQIGNAVIYEWLARGYYWWRGWLAEPDAAPANPTSDS
jgi:uncharacterized SAM-binding protein YcdF (DUF218 family)